MMKFGIFVFPTDKGMKPGDLGRAAEDYGFDSVFVPEHSHIPIESGVPFPRGGEIPAHYYRTHDPFVYLAGVAEATDQLFVGTAVCLITQRDPIHVAKMAASIDSLSGGRFIFGVGAGWNHGEMLNHGTDPQTRFALMGERLGAVKDIWTNEVASYEGTHVRVRPLRMWPKPVQRPHPPVLIGGNGKTVLDRVLAWGDGWIPVGDDEETLKPRLEELRARTRQLGREELPVTLVRAKPEPDKIELYRSIGVTRCLFELPPLDPKEASEELKRYRKLVDGHR